MRKFPRIASALVLSAVAVSCSDQTTSPAVDSPNFSAASVTREVTYAHPIRTLDTDGLPGWDIALFGFQPSDWEVCNGGQTVGGIKVRNQYVVSFEQDGFDLNDPQTWGNGEAIRQVFNTVGAAPLYAYTFASLQDALGAGRTLCDWATNDYFATGQWTALLNFDNDISGWDDTPGMNIFGYNEVGTAQAMDGTVYKYTSSGRARYDGADVFEVMRDEYSFAPVGN